MASNILKIVSLCKLQLSEMTLKMVIKMEEEVHLQQLLPVALQALQELLELINISQMQMARNQLILMEQIML